MNPKIDGVSCVVLESSLYIEATCQNRLLQWNVSLAWPDVYAVMSGSAQKVCLHHLAGCKIRMLQEIFESGRVVMCGRQIRKQEQRLAKQIPSTKAQL